MAISQPQMLMYIFTKTISPRLEYVLKYIFTDLLGLELEITDTKDDFGQHPGVRIAYSEETFPDSLQIFPSGLLFESEIREFEVPVSTYNDTCILFPSEGKGFLPFDIFSAVFYMLSRYEEYLPFQADLHGRFRAEKCLAYQHGFLDTPVVNIWVEWLKEGLTRQYPDIAFKKREFRFIPTIDIDQAYAYRHKGFVRITGGLGKALIKGKLKEVRKRLLVLSRLRKDPFDTFDEIISVHQEYGLSAIWFILFGRYGSYDKNLPVSNRHFRKLVTGLQQHGRIGIHPSYASHDNSLKLKTEVYHLSHLLGEPVSISRQHFLKLSIPHTYRNLISLGITEDYTLGYAHSSGFRAGICDPFPFYDLEKEEETPLTLYPFTIMDGTLKDILHLTPDEAIEALDIFIEKVRAVKGTFISIWHNESLSGQRRWKGWRRVYEEMAKIACHTRESL